VPLKDVPEVRMLAELYRQHRQNQLTQLPPGLSPEERTRYVWMHGASAAVLALVTRKRDSTIDTQILEAWDAEIVDYLMTKLPGAKI
jgi:hypothetical protein